MCCGMRFGPNPAGEKIKSLKRGDSVSIKFTDGATVDVVVLAVAGYSMLAADGTMIGCGQIASADDIQVVGHLDKFEVTVEALNLFEEALSPENLFGIVMFGDAAG